MQHFRRTVLETALRSVLISLLVLFALAMGLLACLCLGELRRYCPGRPALGRSYRKKPGWLDLWMVLPLTAGWVAGQEPFRLLPLREVAQTAPSMHDGSLPTAEVVIEHRSRGGKRNPPLDPELRPLRLTAEEKAVLEAFLRALSGRVSDGISHDTPDPTSQAPSASPVRRLRDSCESLVTPAQ